MSFLKKPEPNKIYRKELPKVGRAANPKLSYDSEMEKLNFFQILVRGLLKEEMDPKQYRRYDNFVLNFKVYGLTILISYILFYVVFHSFAMSGPANENLAPPNWFERGIDNCLNFVADTWDKLKNLF